VDLELLKKIGFAKKYKEEDYICRENDPGDEMYIILAGKVDIMLDSIDGSSMKVSEVCPGGFFGEMSILEGLPRSASAVASEDTILLVIKKENFEIFIEKQPRMALSILKCLSGRIRNLNAQVKRLSAGESVTRADLGHEEEGSDGGNGGAAGSSGKLAQPKAPKDINVSVDSPIFPEGHQVYSLNPPEISSDMVLRKSVKCPVCDKSFEVDMQRVTKLKLLSNDRDFRGRYQDFEPLWYNVWLCPHCFYANMYNDFEKISEGFKKIVLAATTKVKDTVPQANKWPDVNALFAIYYLTLYYYRFTRPHPLKEGKVWLQLSWLYKDCGDEDMNRYCSEKALKLYYDGFFNSKNELSIESEQQCSLLLGELYLRKEDMNLAYRMFNNAINRKAGSPVYNKIAEERIYELRQDNKEHQGEKKAEATKDAHGAKRK